MRVFLPTVRDLGDQQAEMLWPVLGFLRDHRGDMLFGTTDDDVVAAAQALAATCDTAARGLIYEERPSSLPAQRLAADVRPLVAELTRERGSAAERDLAVVWRAVERGAREARKALPGGATAYLEMLRRILKPSADVTENPAADVANRPGDAGSLLIRP